MAKRYVRKKKRNGTRLGQWAILISVVVLAAALVIVLTSRGGDEAPQNSDALWDGSWYGDDLGRIQADRALVRGMKAFQKKTGTQPFLTLLAGVDPEDLNEFAKNQYEALFSEGDHLLVVYDEWGDSSYYLSACAGAQSALTDEDVSRLLACLEKAYADPANDSYAAAFGAGFRQGAREMSVRTEGGGGAGLLLGLGILLAALSVVLILFLRKKARLTDEAYGQNG